MYGKFFASTFTGSMFGAGPEVFAVWAYIIANTDKNSHVELNPRMIAAALGGESESVDRSINFLCTDDPGSRSKYEGGKRLIKKGEFLYEVVNHQKYRAIRNEDDRREYNRTKKAESRARLKDVKALVNDASALSANTDKDTDRKERKNASASAKDVLLSDSTFKESWDLHVSRLAKEPDGKQLERRHLGFCVKLLPRYSVGALTSMVDKAINGNCRYLEEPNRFLTQTMPPFIVTP